MRKHGPYDLEISAGDEWYGYMLDRSDPDHDVDVGEEDQSASIALSLGSPGGDYNWKDQRGIPGVTIADFRGGQGQKVLDRADSAQNAFLDGRFLDCSEENEVRLAPGLIDVICPDMEDRIYEAAGKIWATFDPDTDTEEPERQPKSVRWLDRYEVTLTTAIDTDDDVLVLSSYPAGMEVGDWLYDPVAREVMKVTQLYESGVTDLEVTRGAGFFDDTPENRPAVAHEAGTVLYGYGWRAVDFAFTSPETPPHYHCRSLAFSGEKLYAAFSDSSADGEVWAWPDANDKFEVVLSGLDGVCDLAWGLGRLYYAAEGATGTEAGYIGYDVAGTALEATQLSFDAVVGQEWDLDHFEDVKRKLIQPSVTSKGLAVSGPSCYWLTTSGRDTFLFRLMAPTTFELVKKFPKGFRGNCVAEAFDNIYVGGYYPHADGLNEGVVYLIAGEASERVITLKDPAMDNIIKGLNAVGMFVYLTTNTQLFCYNPQTAGWWHVMDLPPADPVGDIETGLESLWETFTFDTDLPQTKYPSDWSILAQTGASTPSRSIDANSWGPFLKVTGDNCDYITYGFADTTFAGDSASIVVDLAKFAFLDFSRGPTPDDGYPTEGKRRVLEAGIRNGAHEARFRVQAYRDGDWWYLRASLGRWNKTRSRWMFEDWLPGGCCIGSAFSLSLNGTRARMSVPYGATTEMEVSRLKPVTSKRIWFTCGTPLGDALALVDGEWVIDENAGITTTKPFRCCIEKVKVITEDLDQKITVQTPDGTGMLAELDGELFIPIAGDATSGQLVFTRVNETYAGQNAFLMTSDSYQNMGTARKFYRRSEVSHSDILDDQSVDVWGIVDDKLAVGELLEASGLGLLPAEALDSMTIRTIDVGGVRARSMVVFSDAVHLRHRDDRLRINAVSIRFLPNASALKHIYVVNCIDNVEMRDGRKWGVDAHAAIDFIRRMKRTGSIVTVTDDEGSYRGVLDSYQVRYSPKDEHAVATRQGQVKFSIKIIDE